MTIECVIYDEKQRGAAGFQMMERLEGKNIPALMDFMQLCAEMMMDQKQRLTVKWEAEIWP